MSDMHHRYEGDPLVIVGSVRRICSMKVRILKDNLLQYACKSILYCKI